MLPNMDEAVKCVFYVHIDNVSFKNCGIIASSQ